MIDGSEGTLSNEMDGRSGRYAKPIIVPESLELLDGPVTGVVVLPRHLKWSGNARYDLALPGRIVDLYRAVINEAATPADLHTYLDRVTLVTLWPSMWLAAPVRRAWETRFPQLRLRNSAVAA